MGVRAAWLFLDEPQIDGEGGAASDGPEKKEKAAHGNGVMRETQER